jgi:D-ribose pyranose/furanose isomerase RbsD
MGDSVYASICLLLITEIQVKKVFTAEELSMRRQEMARRRRNLSEKRNEEVKVSGKPLLF